jgi:hypothetical protein
MTEKCILSIQCQLRQKRSMMGVTEECNSLKNNNEGRKISEATIYNFTQNQSKRVTLTEIEASDSDTPTQKQVRVCHCHSPPYRIRQKRLPPALTSHMLCAAFWPAARLNMHGTESSVHGSVSCMIQKPYRVCSAGVASHRARTASLKISSYPDQSVGRKIDGRSCLFCDCRP